MDIVDFENGHEHAQDFPKHEHGRAQGVPILFLVLLFGFLKSIGSSQWQGQKFYRFSDFDGWRGDQSRQVAPDR